MQWNAHIRARLSPLPVANKLPVGFKSIDITARRYVQLPIITEAKTTDQNFYALVAYNA